MEQLFAKSAEVRVSCNKACGKVMQLRFCVLCLNHMRRPTKHEMVLLLITNRPTRLHLQRPLDHRMYSEYYMYH